MDAISYSYADKQAKRIKKFINDPDSTSGIVTVPKVIASGENITVPAGRVAVLPNVQVDGVLNVEGEVFIPSGATLSGVVGKVTSTDNAVVRFNGTTGAVQNSGVIIDDSGNVGIGVTPSPLSPLHIYKINANDTTENRLQISRYPDGRGASLIQSYRTDTSSDDLMIAVDSANSNDLTKTKYRISATGKHKWYGSTTSTERMTLNDNGNLLVGTTTDNGVDKLQVYGSISSRDIKVYRSGDLNDFKYITQTIGTYPSIYMSNIPIDDHGYLEVIVYSANNYVMQRFTCLGVTDTAFAGRTFVRCFTWGTIWTPWVEK